MGCLARDNNDNNDANVLHRHPLFSSSTREEKEEIEGTRSVWTNGERGGIKARRCGQRWKTCQLSYSSPEFFVRAVCQKEEGNIISIPSPVTFPLVLSFSFSLIESSNFRLHSRLLRASFADWVRIQRTLCRNLENENPLKGAQPPACGQQDERKTERERETEEKIKNRSKMRGPSYFYRDPEEKSSLPGKTNSSRAAAIGKKFKTTVICPFEKWPRPNANESEPLRKCLCWDTIRVLLPEIRELDSLIHI